MNTIDKLTLSEFVANHKITMSHKPADKTKAMADSGYMDYYRCKLRCQGRTMTVTYSKGSSYRGPPPDATEVLSALGLESGAVDHARSFDDWCSEYGGGDPEARRIFTACRRQARALRRLLGMRAYKELITNTEWL